MKFTVWNDFGECSGTAYYDVTWTPVRASTARAGRIPDVAFRGDRMQPEAARGDVPRALEPPFQEPTMKLPKIESCDATSCSYNHHEHCRAPAITVGHGNEARCDTYWPGDEAGGVPSQIGAVGACRAEACEHNEDLVCTAANVDVGRRGETVDCLTFDTP